MHLQTSLWATTVIYIQLWCKSPKNSVIIITCTISCFLTQLREEIRKTSLTEHLPFSWLSSYGFTLPPDINFFPSPKGFLQCIWYVCSASNKFFHSVYVDMSLLHFGYEGSFFWKQNSWRTVLQHLSCSTCPAALWICHSSIFCLTSCLVRCQP